MKTSYKFIFITLLISSVFFLTLNDIPSPFQNKVLESSTIQDTKNPSESNSLWNSDGMCAEDSLKFHKPNTNNENTTKNEWYLIWQDEFENNCLDSSNWNIED